MAAQEAANWALASIRPAAVGTPPFASLTDDQILVLHFLFSKTLDKAARIIEQGGVYRLEAKPSGRTAFQVMGNPKEHQHYVCFPEHFCSCHAFFFDIVSRGKQICCKHQLAARLASALQLFKLITVTDIELTKLLLEIEDKFAHLPEMLVCRHQLKHDWGKGYSRLGAAFLGLGEHKHALNAYKKGFKFDSNNEALKFALADCSFIGFPDTSCRCETVAIREFLRRTSGEEKDEGRKSAGDEGEGPGQLLLQEETN